MTPPLVQHAGTDGLPRVSVVVMTFNRPSALQRCLTSLAAQTLPATTFEVIVVDVTDPPVRNVITPFADRLQIVHSISPNLGVAGNRNTGVAHSQARIVSFLDDDCVADSNWLQRLTDVVETHPGCLVGGRVVNRDRGSAVAIAGQVITDGVDSFFNPSGEEPRFFPGLNFALGRDRYLAIGGSDGRFGRLAAEDRDFVDRWRLAGGSLVSCPDAIVCHEHRGTLADFVRQHVNYGRGAWRYHSLRRRRSSGRMIEDIRLHLSLHRHLGPPLHQLAPTMRVKVVALLATWQLANLVGYISQGVRESLARGPRDARS